MALTREQLAVRKTGIGGSDIAAVCGISRFRTPLQVWAEKTGEVEPAELTGEDIDRGNFLERALVEWYCKKTGRTASLLYGTTERDADAPWRLYTPDDLTIDFGVTGGSRLLEIKAPGVFAADWGEAGTEHVPPEYYAQVQWGMGVLRVATADIAALIDGELRIYPIRRDEEVIAGLRERADAFWHENVLKRVPPEVTSDKDLAYFKARFPRDTEPPLGPEALSDARRRMVEAWAASREARLAAEKQEGFLAAQLQAVMQGHSGWDLGDGRRIAWKQNRASEKVDWEAVARALAEELRLYSDLRVDADERLAARIAEHTTKRDGARPFMLYGKKMETT